MRKVIASALIVAFLGFGSFGCTNMSPTEQGAVSGGVIGAGAGAGIGLLTGGNLVTGALIGGAIGAIGGGLYGNSEEDN
jgi:osmotically inducible lipoprotein OsmB